MFKQASFEDELFRSMEKSLVKNQTEKTYGLNKLAKAVDYLNDAAAIFEGAGMLSEASQIVNILQSMAKELDGKTVNIGGHTYPKIKGGEYPPSIGTHFDEYVPHKFVLECDTGYFLIRIKDQQVVGVEEL